MRKVTVKSDRLALRAGGGAFACTLDEARQGTIAVRLQLGTAAPWCADVPARARNDPATAGRYDTTGLFIGQPKASPVEQCPLPGTAP